MFFLPPQQGKVKVSSLLQNGVGLKTLATRRAGTALATQAGPGPDMSWSWVRVPPTVSQPSVSPDMEFVTNFTRTHVLWQKFYPKI